MNMKSMILTAMAVTLTTAANAADYLVKYKSSWALQNVLSSNSNVKVMDVQETARLMKVRINKSNEMSALVGLFTNPNVEYVVPNFKIKAFTAPVDTAALKEQWAIGKVQAQKAWDLVGKGSRSVTVAVIDTGVDYKHKNLAPNMVPGYDFAKDDNDPQDTTSAQNPGHGTHCAGIVGASGIVDDGIVGLSPEVSIMPLRFLDESGSGDLNNAIKAIDYAIEKGVQVMSASWGASVPRSTAQPLIEAIQRAEKAGIIFVVAAANDGKNNDKTEVYPANANLSNTIAVSASNSSDAKPSWSNYGRAKVNVAAPGDGIMSTLPSDKYGNLSGTSMATPLVSGLVALVKSADPKLTPSEVRSLLQATGAKVQIETACDCRVDAFEAVNTVKNKKMFVSPNAATLEKGSKTSFTGVYGTAPFKFESSNAATATIDAATGELTAVADGDTVVTVTDANGVKATSYKIYVGASSGGGDPGQPPAGECPIDNPLICIGLCLFEPSLPWCEGLGGGLPGMPPASHATQVRTEMK